jgi:hypothetical protein
MRKVLISAITACALATSAHAADDMLPTDEAREAAPIGLVGEPWPPGSELGASNFTMQPWEPVPYTIDRADNSALREAPTTIGGDDLPTPQVNPKDLLNGSQGAAAAAENEAAGRPFWQLAPALVFEQMNPREPMFVPYGPFMIAVKRPPLLMPREYNAQASVPLADCPQPDAADDEALCQPH